MSIKIKIRDSEPICPTGRQHVTNKTNNKDT